MTMEFDTCSIHLMVHCLQHCRATSQADGQFTDGSSKDQGWAGGKIWWNQLSSQILRINATTLPPHEPPAHPQIEIDFLFGVGRNSTSVCASAPPSPLHEQSNGRTLVGQVSPPPLPSHGPRGFMITSNCRTSLLGQNNDGPTPPITAEGAHHTHNSLLTHPPTRTQRRPAPSQIEVCRTKSPPAFRRPESVRPLQRFTNN